MYLNTETTAIVRNYEFIMKSDPSGLFYFFSLSGLSLIIMDKTPHFHISCL